MTGQDLKLCQLNWQGIQIIGNFCYFVFIKFSNANATLYFLIFNIFKSFFPTLFKLKQDIIRIKNNLKTLLVNYFRFWWVFVARNLIDRIIPFFALVLMNFLIIKTLKREHKRDFKNISPPLRATYFQAVASIAVKSKTKVKHLRKEFRIRRARSGSTDDNINKKNLKVFF